MIELTQHQKDPLEGYGASSWCENWTDEGEPVIDLTQNFYRSSYTFGDRYETRTVGTVSLEEWERPLDLDRLDRNAEDIPDDATRRGIHRLTALVRRMRHGAKKLKAEAELRGQWAEWPISSIWSDVEGWASSIYVGADEVEE